MRSQIDINNRASVRHAERRGNKRLELSQFGSWETLSEPFPPIQLMSAGCRRSISFSIYELFREKPIKCNCHKIVWSITTHAWSLNYVRRNIYGRQSKSIFCACCHHRNVNGELCSGISSKPQHVASWTCKSGLISSLDNALRAIESRV